MEHFEIFIDMVLVYVPENLPFVSDLMVLPEGRYIIFALLALGLLMSFWVLFAMLEMINASRKRVSALDGIVDVDQPLEAGSESGRTLDKDGGFSFFKKADEKKANRENGDEAELIAVEQEMLAVRSLYADGHIIKAVYVSETRRLYDKAIAYKGR